MDRSKWHTSNLYCQFRTGSKKFGCAGLFVAFTVKAVLFPDEAIVGLPSPAALVNAIIVDVARQYGVKP